MRLAKYNLYRYIGCIIDQSNWSGPFSLVVMAPDLESGDCGSRPGQVESFYLQVYISPPTTHINKQQKNTNTYSKTFSKNYTKTFALEQSIASKYASNMHL